MIKNMSDHHVIPKSRGGKEKRLICVACHQKIHSLFTNKELEEGYNTIDSIREHIEMSKFIKWIAKRSPDHIPRSDRVRERKIKK